ncbi:hypothetical protein [Streptomyces sp. Y1]|uniref:Uncharacterized protein n=1 Tax=Streptomyces sp. Y1 TaxID=3238634 RepID=A0AB39TMV7_9ACTN
MSYELQALIGTLELLTVAAAEVPVARVVPLAQGLAMLPVTSAVLAALQGDGAAARTSVARTSVAHPPAAHPSAAGSGFGRHADGFELRLAAWSKAGPIACVEAESFGDGGIRRAAVWSDGRIVLGPLAEGESVEGESTEGEPVAGESVEGGGGDPISRALRLLGVRVTAGRVDECDAVGLSAHRSTTGWAAAVG